MKIVNKKILTILASCSLVMSSQSFAERIGFLDKDHVPSIITLVSPPPAEGSALYKNDVEKFYEGQKQKDTPRWRVAAREADLSINGLLHAFSPAMGIEMSNEKTPEIFELVKKAKVDLVKFGSKPVKKYYQRVRPYVKLKEHTCLIEEEAEHAKSNGSYPSSHTTIGTGIALLLAEINPDRADRILEKGRDFGENRVICGYHWDSDVRTGRNIAAIMVSALHANKAFNEQMAKAKAEFSSVK